MLLHLGDLLRSHARLLALSCAAALLPALADARPARKPATAQARAGEAEARLIEIYKLIGRADTRAALAKAEALVAAHPNFQLAQLVYGDLLMAQQAPVRAFGDVPDTELGESAGQLAELREESRLRMRALRDRPPAGAVPAQFLQLSPKNRHAIAIDASRARLYLFENGANGLKLLGDYYISVGKAGVQKEVEGDARTPLGLYHVTSNLDPTSLKDFYGAGALPINYPNPYDVRRGKTGSGIWLHGTPPTQFSRSPKASDGCVVLANPDLLRIVRTVETRTTPVLIAASIEWVAPAAVQPETRRFAKVLQDWREAKASGDLERMLSFYTSDFTLNGKPLAASTPILKVELNRTHGREIELKDLSFMRWTDEDETMVVTFGEVPRGSRTGPIKRQYWVKQGPHWKIFFEGVIG